MVRLPNPLGDAVMALPLLSNIKQRFPDCRLSLVGNPEYESLFSGLSHIDQFVALDNSLSIAEQSKILEEQQCDTIILCPNSWSSALVARKAGIKQRIGRTKHLRSFLLTHSLPAIDKPRLMPELYCELITAFGVGFSVDPAYLPAPEIAVSWAPPKLGYFMVAPGAAFGSSKQYPAHLMATALNGIHAKHQLLPVLFGAPSEHQSLIELSKLLDHPFIVAKQYADFNEIKHVMKKASFVLSMDSGARHIAVAVGTPQLAIFGPTDPSWTAHAMDGAVFVANDKLDCLGCHHKTCPLKGHPCMNDLDPQIIIDASSRFIA